MKKGNKTKQSRKAKKSKLPTAEQIKEVCPEIKKEFVYFREKQNRVY